MPGSGVTELRLVGGGTRDLRFQQLLADVLGRPVRRCRTENVTALGAARLGWVTLGHELRGWSWRTPLPRAGPLTTARDLIVSSS